MPDYKKLYHIMFNAATDAVGYLDGGDCLRARGALVSAQREAEEEYISGDKIAAVIDTSVKNGKIVTTQLPKGEQGMKVVSGIGISYQITGEKEEAAAQQLEEALSAVSKRRNAYVQGEIDDILTELRKSYGVEIKTTL